MLPDKDIGCHRSGFQKTCFECVTQHRCRLWTHIVGLDPNTGQPLDYYGCADELQPKLLLEAAKESRQTAAAVESFRNETIKRQDVQIALARKDEARALPQIIDITPDES